MGQEALRQKLTQRLSKDAQGVIRTLKSAGVKLSQQEEASMSRGSLDQFSDSQLTERFNPKVLGMLGISGSEQSSSKGQGQSWQQEGRNPQGKNQPGRPDQKKKM